MKAMLLAFVALAGGLLAGATGAAGPTIVTGSSVDNNANHEDYLGIFEDDHSQNATFSDEDVVFGPTPRAGTLRNLRAQISSAHLTNGSWIITVHAGAAAPGSAYDDPQQRPVERGGAGWVLRDRPRDSHPHHRVGRERRAADPRVAVLVRVLAA